MEEESDGIDIDPSEIEWVPPHEPMNETFWEITVTESNFSLTKFFVWLVAIAILIAITIYLIRRFSSS